MDAPNKADMLDVFIRALDGADRVVVQTRNALGEYDTQYLHAPELLAAWNRRADLRPRVKALQDTASFLIDRLSEFELSDDADQMARDYMGHVEPAVARMCLALAALEE